MTRALRERPRVTVASLLLATVAPAAAAVLGAALAGPSADRSTAAEARLVHSKRTVERQARERRTMAGELARARRSAARNRRAAQAAQRRQRALQAELRRVRSALGPRPVDSVMQSAPFETLKGRWDSPSAFW